MGMSTPPLSAESSEKMSFDSALEALGGKKVLIVGDGFDSVRGVQDQLQSVCGYEGGGPFFQPLSFADRAVVQEAFLGDVSGVVVVDLAESAEVGDRENVVTFLREMKGQRPERPFVYLRVCFVQVDPSEQGIFDKEYDFGSMLCSVNPDSSFQELLIGIAEGCRS